MWWRVFVDFNGNFVYDAGETPLPGRTVSLVRLKSPVQATDSSGQFRFLWRAAGAIRVASSAVPRATLARWPRNAPSMSGLASNTVVDFPLLATGVIQGAVFEDYNGNGLQDGGRPGVAGTNRHRSGGGLPDDVATTRRRMAFTITDGCNFITQLLRSDAQRL